MRRERLVCTVVHSLYYAKLISVSSLHAPELTSSEASTTFGHANANFLGFIDHIRNQFVKK